MIISAMTSNRSLQDVSRPTLLLVSARIALSLIGFGRYVVLSFPCSLLCFSYPFQVRVDFSYNDLGSTGAVTLAKTLPQCNNLHSLSLRGSNFKPENIAPFTDALIMNSSIKRIDLGLNVKPGKSSPYMSASCFFSVLFPLPCLWLFFF
jgi:hypothetical protein